VGTGSRELAITNMVPKPGSRTSPIYIYDQNGLIDYVCQKLNEKQVEYIDLADVGLPEPGFKGSCDHLGRVLGARRVRPQGVFLWNLVGLGAVVIERTGTRQGENVPGDEAAGARGIPF
jgi:hypothetical protein